VSLQNLLGQAGQLNRPTFLAMLRADQRKRWQRGERFLVESYLPRLPRDLADEESVLDLIYNETLLREERGEAPTADEYVRRFPQFESQLRRQFAVNALLGSESLLDLDGEMDAAEGGPPVTCVLDQPLPVPEIGPAPFGSIGMPAPATVADSGSPVEPRRGPELPRVAGYELIQELGRGGMGVVYKARQLSLKRIVALKMILAGAHAGEQELARMQSEAVAVGRLQNPNIVQIYEVGQQDALPYLALEYVDGGSLADKLNGTPLPPDQAAHVVERLADAMHYAHLQGVVHRDLKPANILLAAGGSDSGSHGSGFTSSFLMSRTALGTPKITDFGLAKQLEGDSRVTRSGAIVGTPSYMAPEQAAARTEQIGPLTDVYSLGAILYECLTGRPPFRAATPVDTVLQVLAEDPVAPTRLNPKVPRDLETICLKCLEKEPRKRYASAEKLGEDLRRFLFQEPITARPVGPLERAVKWARRRPTIAALLASLLLVVALGFSLVTWYWLEAEDARQREANARANEKSEKLAKGAALEQAEQTLYYSRIGLADRLWSDNNVAGVAGLLGHYSDDRRNWEWHYLRRLCAGGLFTVAGQNCVAYRPGGKVMAVGAGNDIKLCDAASGKLLRTLEGHRNKVNRVTFSADGDRLASASDDYTVRIWDPENGALLRTLAGHEEPVLDVAFSIDGKRIASATNNDSIKVWDPATGKAIKALEGHSSVTFRPDGKVLAGCSAERDVKLWDTASWVELRTLAGPHGHTGPVNSVVFAPDGKLLATGSDDQTVKLWDAATGEEQRTLRGHAGRVARVAFSADGRRLASVGGDVAVPGALKVWEIPTGMELRTYRWPSKGGLDVAFAPDGHRFASADLDAIQVWDADNDLEARTCRGHTAEVSCVAFSPDGRRLASGDGDGTVRIWDAASGKQVLACLGHFSGVTSVAFSPDGRWLASASADKTVLLWDPATGKEVRTLRHPGVVTCLAFRPHGSQLATACLSTDSQGEVKLWDPGSGEEMRTIPDGWIVGLSFSPDGSRLAGLSRAQMVHVWDPDTGREELTLANDKAPVPFSCVQFSPDGRFLVTTGGTAERGLLKIWNARSGEEMLTYRGLAGRLGRAAFRPDGKRLAVAAWNHTVRLCDAQTGQEILTLRGHTDWVTGIAFSPDGTRIASASADRTVRIWDATPLPWNH